MPPSISSLGVGSGLDLSSLLDSFRSSEESRLVPLQNRKSSYSAEVSAFGTLGNAVSNLQAAADKLNDPALFNSTQTRASGDAVAATSSGNAAPGQYRVEVSQRAQSQSLVADGIADKTADIGDGGQLTLAVGSDDPVTIDLASGASSLGDIRDAINGADAGVSASLLDDGSDAPFRLVLSAQDSGADNQISLTATDADTASGTPLADLLNYDGTSRRMTETVAAQDALISANGIDIRRSSNTVDDAIQGVTLSLNDTTQVPSEITTERDTESVRSAIEGFVSAYSDYQRQTDNLTSFNGPDSNNGVLLGNSTVRSIESRLNAALSTSVNDNSLSRLSEIGIALQSDGRLEIEDSDKLDTALAEDPGGVQGLFTGDQNSGVATDQGVAGALSASIEQMTDSRGLLTTTTEGLQNRIDGVDDRISDTRRQIDATIERYREQFVALDSMVSKLNSTQSYLQTQLGQTGGQSDSS